MTYFVYILQSEAADKFYIGQTSEIQERLIRHNEGEADKFTLRYRPWSVFHTISCSSRKQARMVEAHLKRMKSKKYLRNLKEHPQIQERLLMKYQDQSI